MEILNPYTIPGFPVFLLMFLLIYLFGYFILFRNWGGGGGSEASSCLISLAHGTPSLLLALHSLHHHHTSSTTPPRPPSYASKNTHYQNTVLEFSMAYFSIDLIHLLLFSPSLLNQFPFIAHHLAALFVFATCRFAVGHGAYGILVLLVLAEATSACQNAWTLAGVRRGGGGGGNVGVATRVHEVLRVPFYGVYSVARGVLGPMFVYEMGVFYASGAGGEEVPMWVWASWMVLIVGAIMGSLLWVSNLWMDLYRERKGKGELVHHGNTLATINQATI